MAVSSYFKTFVIHSDTNVVIVIAIRASEQIFRIKSAEVEKYERYLNICVRPLGPDISPLDFYIPCHSNKEQSSCTRLF